MPDFNQLIEILASYFTPDRPFLYRVSYLLIFGKLKTTFNYRIEYQCRRLVFDSYNDHCGGQPSTLVDLTTIAEQIC